MAGNTVIPYGMRVPVAVWRLGELLYPCCFTVLYLLFYSFPTGTVVPVLCRRISTAVKSRD